MTRDDDETLKNLEKLAQARGDSKDIVLNRFIFERLLYRLSISPFADDFLLKGAMLFPLWGEHPFRPIRGLDLHGLGAPDANRLVQVFRDLCDINVADDALEFDTTKITAEAIKEDHVFDGMKIEFTAKLGKTSTDVQVGVAFGDSPEELPKPTSYPVLLDHKAPVVRACSKESVIAEKIASIISLGLASSEMKDFFDVFTLSRQYSFDGPTLADALRQAFDGLETALPHRLPVTFTREFGGDSEKLDQWRALLKELPPNADMPADLQDVVLEIKDFVWPLFQFIEEKSEFCCLWQKGGPWCTRT